MAIPPLVNWDVAVQLEQELQAMVKVPDASYEDVNHHLDLLRLAITTVTFNDIQDGTTSEADSLLWDVSCAINKKFRKALARFKSNDQRKFVVEKNKLAKRYAIFIKTSQYFYKSHIQQLNARFDGIIILQKIAHKLGLSPQSVEERIQLTPQIEAAINKSVHSTLLHLGDLSRYRNELRTTEKVWDHALAYYGLAADLLPTDGSAYNQMAVISLQDQNHLDAVYYLYRALAIENPHPQAKKNLELEFKKLISMWRSANSSSSSAHHTPAETAAITWLLRLHALLYKSEELTNHDEIETEVICQTTTLLKDQSLEQDILNKFALINIAAEHLALARLKVFPSYNNKKSYFGLLRLNVRTFFMLLQVLQPEFRSDEYEDLPGNEEQPEKITPVMRHILPTLRHYSIWLVSQAETISAFNFGAANSDETNDDMGLTDSLRIYVKEMWREFASTLCLFCAAFPPRDLHEFPDANYLLKEDVATVGFKPFTNQEIAPFCEIYYTHDGILKPRITDQGVMVEESRNEMISRIKSIIRDAVVIAHRLQNIPIKIADGEEGVFYFIEERLPTIRPTNGHSPGRSMSSLEMKRTLSERDEVRGHALGGTILPDTEFTHDSVDQRMNDMVAELIGSREDTYGMNTRAANELFADVQVENPIQATNVNDLMSPFQNVSHIPSPRANELAMGTPNELEHSQPKISTIKSRQFADADTLDTITRGGIHARRTQVPQYGENTPKSTDRHPQLVSTGILTPSEIEHHVYMFNNAFSNSSWKNNSNIIAGTPYKSRTNISQQVVSTARPLHPGGHNPRSSSTLTGSGLLLSSGPGAYGNSGSYEREMMLQSQLPGLSGTVNWMQTPPNGQG